jgi:hypothetical protein
VVYYIAQNLETNQTRRDEEEEDSAAGNLGVGIKGKFKQITDVNRDFYIICDACDLIHNLDGFLDFVMIKTKLEENDFSKSFIS